MAELKLDLEEDIPTRETCGQCGGTGEHRVETNVGYKVIPNGCRWCGGTGRRPISGMVPKQ